MSNRRAASPILPIAVTLAVLLLIGYVVAYYAMVGLAVAWDHPLVPDNTAVPIYHLPGAEPSWQYPSRWATFFAPIHWLDRRIRPHAWKPMP